MGEPSEVRVGAHHTGEPSVKAPQHYIPREYGRLATSFLLNTQRAGLWAKPGMGKTAIVYSTLDILKLSGSNFFPVLIMAPLKVAELVWPAEQTKWDAFSGMRVAPILGSVKEREEALYRRADVYVVNYDNVPWLVKRMGNKWPFKTVVADESTRLKNFRLRKQGGVRAAALEEIANLTGRWINLTGTPAPNGLRDLWGQTWFQDFGARLGHSYTDFFKRWFYEDRYTRIVEPRAGASEEIHGKLADITMALRPEDWMDIREPVVTMREVLLPDEAMKHYKRMEKEFFAEIKLGTEIEAMNAAVKSMKLLQMCSGAVYDAEHTAHELHDAKLEALESIVNECGGEPILVVYHFKFEVPRLMKRFPGARVFEKQKDEEDWNAGKIPLMLIHPQRGGHGTNLQYGGRIMVFFTHTWDLELRLQVIERIGPVRQKQAGFDRSVLVYDLVAKNTLDVDVLERLTSKLSVQESLMRARARTRGESELTLPVWTANVDLL